MKLLTSSFVLSVATLSLSLFNAPAASAQCGGYAKPAAFHGTLQSAQPHLLATAFEEHDKNPIVGLWHVKFLAKGVAGIPDGTEIDAGFSAWHSDGTEILNSGLRAPRTSNFCLGVWQQTGHETYKLNHFAISYDPSGTYLVGPANIKESIKLLDECHYKGTFTIDQFDEKHNLLAHLQGIITGTRVDIDTPAEPVE